MTAIRYVLVCLLVAFIIIVYNADRTPTVSFQDIEAAYTESGLLDGLDVQNERQLERYLGITPAMSDEVIYWKSPNPMSADEMLLIKAKDDASLSQIEDAISDRVDDQVNLFGDYAPEEVAKLNSHIMDVRGDYVLYGVGDRAEQWDSVFDGIQ